MISARSFSAASSAIRDALAIVDGDVRLTYAQWYRRISAVVAGFDGSALKPGDHLVTVLQNRWEAATLHWACQFAGIVITPVNWRAKADELDYCLENADAKALVFEDVSAEAVARLQGAACPARRRCGEHRVAWLDLTSAPTRRRAPTPTPGR